MGARVLVIDNYDSFVYNLVQELGELGADPVVFRNDAIDIDGIRAERPDAVLISPGPGRPKTAGVRLAAIAELAGEIPILGVCLGHQCHRRGLRRRGGAGPDLMHGKTSEIHHNGAGVFAGLPDPFVATRYHSLVVDPSSVPDTLVVTATTADGVVMGLRHRELAVEGVQFHPESLLTLRGPASSRTSWPRPGPAERPARLTGRSGAGRGSSWSSWSWSSSTGWSSMWWWSVVPWWWAAAEDRSTRGG